MPSIWAAGWGWLAGTVVFDRPSPREGVVDNVANIIEGMLVVGFLALICAVALWLTAPTVVAALFRWPRVGAALGLQIALGAVVIPVVFWMYVKLSDSTGATIGFIPVAIATAAAIPAASRWYVERGGTRKLSP